MFLTIILGGNYSSEEINQRRKLFKERKLIKGGNYMRKYGIWTWTWDIGITADLYQAVS